MHEVLVNRLGGLSLPRKSVVRLIDRPDMTIDVYRGRKTTTTQQQQHAMNLPGERRCENLRIIRSRIYDGLRPRQGNLRLVFKLFNLKRGMPSSIIFLTHYNFKQNK